jgi:O-acetyl-ADP-ribose deacetylase (regulator of RNase III)
MRGEAAWIDYLSSCFTLREGDFLISFISGDATAPVGKGSKVVVHVCNNVRAWGAGFVLSLSRRWPTVQMDFLNQFDSGLNIGGDAVFTQVAFQDGSEIFVAGLVGQDGIRSINNRVPVRYDWIKLGLSRVNSFAKHHNASVHMPRIGCGLAGGTWDNIQPLIEETLAGVNVVVYDLPERHIF